MNREVHVRFWESPEVKILRATRQRTSPLARESVAREAARMYCHDEPVLLQSTKRAGGDPSTFLGPFG
jgi:hypothetical protein